MTTRIYTLNDIKKMLKEVLIHTEVDMIKQKFDKEVDVIERWNNCL